MQCKGSEKTSLISTDIQNIHTVSPEPPHKLPKDEMCKGWTLVLNGFENRGVSDGIFPSSDASRSEGYAVADFDFSPSPNIKHNAQCRTKSGKR